MNRLGKLITVFACVTPSFLVGCTNPSAFTPTTTSRDVGPTFGMTTIDGIEYEYVATPDRESQIIAGFAKVKLGQSREEVRAAMGLPDSAQAERGKAYNAPFGGWYYMYKIKMRTGGPHTNDVFIEVFFNTAGELYWAVPNYIAGLKEIGTRQARNSTRFYITSLVIRS